VVEVNPKVRVRTPEQEEEECVSPENNSGSWMLSKFIELLYFEGKFYLVWCLFLIPLQIYFLGLSSNTKFLSLREEEKKHSVSKSTRVCPQHVTMRSTPSTKGWDFPWYISLALFLSFHFNDGWTCTGVLKSVKRVGESPKENARASSVIRPRAVLSSPGK